MMKMFFDLAKSPDMYIHDSINNILLDSLKKIYEINSEFINNKKLSLEEQLMILKLNILF